MERLHLLLKVDNLALQCLNQFTIHAKLLSQRGYVFSKISILEVQFLYKVVPLQVSSLSPGNFVLRLLKRRSKLLFFFLCLLTAEPILPESFSGVSCLILEIPETRTIPLKHFRLTHKGVMHMHYVMDVL